ncbi:MAG: acetyl-CoA carboxylase biotin carboxyl carrier protein [Merismopedia sp. SIO2A8]|nr:acetyl-CoA carboxylase biotin carboxyl carrier protein [Merismopedia sp. SIO2A8]
MDLSFNELRELLTAIDQTDIAELDLKSGDWELSIRKAAQGAVVIPQTSSTSVVAPVAPVAPAAIAPVQLPPPTQAAPTPPPPIADNKLVEVKSPMVGTFYRAPAPDESPFVAVGDRISTGQTVCIIEAMKLMNELEAEISGKIVDILVENAEPVEFGQVLMRVDPG